MKVAYLKESSTLPGREITIYLLKFDRQYEQSENATNFGLCLADEHSEEYWFKMASLIEKYLDSY